MTQSPWSSTKEFASALPDVSAEACRIAAQIHREMDLGPLSYALAEALDYIAVLKDTKEGS